MIKTRIWCSQRTAGKGPQAGGSAACSPLPVGPEERPAARCLSPTISQIGNTGRIAPRARGRSAQIRSVESRHPGQHALPSRVGPALCWAPGRESRCGAASPRGTPAQKPVRGRRLRSSHPGRPTPALGLALLVWKRWIGSRRWGAPPVREWRPHLAEVTAASPVADRADGDSRFRGARCRLLREGGPSEGDTAKFTGGGSRKCQRGKAERGRRADFSCGRHPAASTAFPPAWSGFQLPGGSSDLSTFCLSACLSTYLPTYLPTSLKHRGEKRKRITIGKSQRTWIF